MTGDPTAASAQTIFFFKSILARKCGRRGGRVDQNLIRCLSITTRLVNAQCADGRLAPLPMSLFEIERWRTVLRHKLWLSSQRPQATSEPVDTTARQAEGHAVRLAEFLSSK